jgi:hypothetical protein
MDQEQQEFEAALLRSVEDMKAGNFASKTVFEVVGGEVRRVSHDASRLPASSSTLPGLHVEADRSIGGHFLHGINLDDDILVYNLGVSKGRLVTTDMLGLTDPGLAETYRRIADIPIEELASAGLEGNVLSPRAAKYVIPAAILNGGQEIVDGHGRGWEISEGRKRRIVETSDIEMAFEEGRRRFAPAAPSRLSCIWLAEDSDTGRAVILSMIPGAYVCYVRVEFCLGVKVADAGWFDDYMNHADHKYIESYWTGAMHPRHSTPEILVDGVLQLTDPSQLEHIKRFGRSMFG